MPVGMEVYNENGKLIADTFSPVLTFHSKGTLTTHAPTTLVSGQSSLTLALPSGVDLPVVAFNHDQPIGLHYRHAGQLVFNCKSGQGVSVSYYLFEMARKIMAPSASGVGLELYDENGNVTFSSIAKIANVVAVNSGLAIPGGRVYAAAVPSFCGRRSQSLSNPDDPESQRLQTSYQWGGFSNRYNAGTTGYDCGFEEFFYHDPNIVAEPAPAYNRPLVGGLILDVTGF